MTVKEQATGKGKEMRLKMEARTPKGGLPSLPRSFDFMVSVMRRR